MTAPFHQIDKDKVELACDKKGCALIPDDGNPHNDIIPEDYYHIHDHPNDGHYHLHGHGDHQHEKPDMGKIKARYHDDPDQFKSGNNSDSVDLPMVGGHVKLGDDVDEMLAKAAYDEKNAVFVNDGVAYLVPMDAIDTKVVKLVCNAQGCALMAKDPAAW